MGRGSVFNSFAGLDVGKSVVEVDLRKVHYDESIITGSSGGNWADTARTLKLIADGDFRIDPHIKLVGDLNHAVEFIKMVNKGEVDGKAIVYPHAKLDRPITVKGEWTKRDEESLPPRDRK
jgi:D-arabinose 1-dehydrogenase-like Zn-dependent alcohol dehydrogenase